MAKRNRLQGIWTIPSLWTGATVFIIGGGPSLLLENLTPIQGQRIIGVNQAYKLGPWIDVVFFGDKQWYPGQLPQIRQFGGLIVTCAAEAQPHRQWKRVKYVARGRSLGIESKRRSHIAWNGNSGGAAVSLAYWLGAKKIILLGFDMKLPEDPLSRKDHWHDDYEPRVDRKTGKLINPYERFMRGWPVIAREAKALGVEIINASQDSALDMFKFQKLESICRHL